jgi:WD40 repeat protein
MDRRLYLPVLSAALLLTGISLWDVPFAAGQKPGRTIESDSQEAGSKDSQVSDESLPDGAIVRLGSMHLQQDEEINMLAFSPDGKTLVTGGRSVNRARGPLDNVYEVGEDGRAAVRTGLSPANTLMFWHVASANELRKMSRGLPNVLKLAFSADGKSLKALSLDNSGDTGSVVVGIVELAPGTEMRQVKLDGLHMANGDVFDISANGKTIAWCSAQEREGTKATVQLSDAESGKKLAEWETGRKASSVALSPDATVLAIASAAKNQAIQLWDVGLGKELRQLDESAGYKKPCFSPNGKMLAAVGPAKTAALWDSSNGKLLRKIEGHSAIVYLVAFSTDGKLIASVSADRSVRLWDAADGKQLHEWNVEVGPSSPIAFSADGKLVGVGTSTSEGGTIAAFGRRVDRSMVRLFDTASGAEVGPKAASHASLQHVSCSRDGTTVATVGKDNVIRLWDGGTGKEIRTFAAEGGVSSVFLSGDGKQLWIVGADAMIKMRETATGKESVNEISTDVPLQRSAFSTDGKFLVAVGQKGDIVIHDVERGKELRSIKVDNGTQAVVAVACAAVSPDGKLVAASIDNKIRVWELATGKMVHWKKKRDVLSPGDASAVAFTPDGHYLVSQHSKVVRVWELATGEAVDEIKSPGPSEVKVKFPGSSLPGPDGKTTESPPMTIYRQPGTLALSPDGRILATASGSQISLVDLNRAGELPTLAGHQSDVNSAWFSSDGRRLVSVSDDTTGLVWDAARLMRSQRSLERTKREVKAMWDNLADEDESTAYRAACELANSAPAAVVLLRERLKPVPVPSDAKRIDALIADLDADEVQARQKAYDELDDLGEKAEGALRRALKAGPSLEARRQMDKLLQRSERMSPERLRLLRTVAALEWSANTEARQLLKSLAEGEPGAWLTEEAMTAMERVSKRPE